MTEDKYHLGQRLYYGNHAKLVGFLDDVRIDWGEVREEKITQIQTIETLEGIKKIYHVGVSWKSDEESLSRVYHFTKEEAEKAHSQNNTERIIKAADELISSYKSHLKNYESCIKKLENIKKEVSKSNNKPITRAG